MKKYLCIVTLFFSLGFSSLAVQAETIVHLETATGTLEGTLLFPDGKSDVPVALIIAGSGPTDRDGNNPAMQNNSLKMLAVELLDNAIASLRYDKRAIGKSREAGLEESDLRFENYIEDAIGWIDFLKKDPRFSQIVLIGHSEGSLIGMIASQGSPVDKFISIAGAGLSADLALKEQLKAQPPAVIDMASPIIDQLTRGETVNNINPMLYSLFRPSIQPYLISWFKYDPKNEIAKLKIPVLLIQGTTDIQVSLNDLRMLSQANSKAETKIIDGMNHIFKESDSDRLKNIATYNQPELPIKHELTEAVVGFVKR